MSAARGIAAVSAGRLIVNQPQFASNVFVTFVIHSINSSDSLFVPNTLSPEPCGAKGQEYCLLITVPGAKCNANTEERNVGRWRKKKIQKDEDRE